MSNLPREEGWVSIGSRVNLPPTHSGTWCGAESSSVLASLGGSFSLEYLSNTVHTDLGPQNQVCDNFSHSGFL